MQMNINKKLYRYEYRLIDMNWEEILETGDGEVVADDMKEAVDVAFSFIQLKYFHKYDYPNDIDIDIYKIEKVDL